VIFAGPAKFELGQVVGTPQALRFCSLHNIEVFDLLRRHASGDWGNLGADDAAANSAALIDGSRILSAYMFPVGKVWLLTEAEGDDGHRTSTCLMLPTDY
jgi:hypothetical protein